MTRFVLQFPDGFTDPLPPRVTLREALEITRDCAAQGEVVRFRQVLEEIDGPLPFGHRMIFGSVCSGIEAASTAWEPLGWRAAWVAEIEPFPSAVLAHHWPEVPNLGDFTKIRDRLESWESPAPEVLVGGTPCQAFSVAGLRQSMDDARGQLTLEFVRLANAIDTTRSLLGIPECIAVWENVPGVLNTPDNAFGCFLGALCGEDDALLPPGGRWTNAGRVLGPSRAVAWRILDAQYFGVAQRRRRVFVVASARKGFDPTEVLFEFDGVRRDSPPSRETGQGSSADAGRGAGKRSHWEGGPHPSLNQSNNIGGVGMSNQELFSQRGAYLAPCLQAGEKTAGSATQQDAENGALVVEPRALAIQERAAHPNLNAGPGGKGFQEGVAYTLEARHHVQACCVSGDVFHTLRAEGHDASEEWTGRGAGAVVPPEGAPRMQVRRLTPTEAERLQGFPDGHTRIPWRGKGADECPDGPRHKALGNSMAVPVMAWLGERIEKALGAGDVHP